MNSSLGQSGMDGYKDVSDEKSLNPYANHSKAVAQWHQACRNHERTANEKAQAAKVLEEANAILGKHIAEAICDPTIPRPEIQMPRNGGLARAAMGPDACPGVPVWSDVCPEESRSGQAGQAMQQRR